MSSWRVGYDWTSLPPTYYAPDKYAVFMCPAGAFVTSLGLYASANFYGSSNDSVVNYIGVHHHREHHVMFLAHALHIVYRTISYIDPWCMGNPGRQLIGWIPTEAQADLMLGAMMAAPKALS